MSCVPCRTAANGDAYAACAGFPALSTEDDATLEMYAAQAGAPSTGPNSWIMCVCVAFLRSRRFIYYKNSPGDCGQKTAINIGVAGAVGPGLTTVAVADPEPISKGILSALGTIAGLFGQAHAQAVATEQATLCDVANAYNQNAAAIENALASGQISVAQATATIQSLVQQLIGLTNKVARGNAGSATCDAGCGYDIALQALANYNVAVVYPALSNPVSAVLTNPVAVLSNPWVLIGLGALALIIIGGKHGN